MNRGGNKRWRKGKMKTTKKGRGRTRIVRPAIQERAAGERGSGDGGDDLEAHVEGKSAEEGRNAESSKGGSEMT